MQLKLMLRSVGYVMHMRRKVVKRTEEKFYVSGEEIGIVEECKYLGCVVNEHLHSYCIRMVEERAKNEQNSACLYCRRVGHLPPTLFDHPCYLYLPCFSYRLV